MEERIYHLNLRGMSGRVVKFRILDPDMVEQCEANGARDAGEGASRDELRVAQLRKCIAAMIVGYTDKGFPPQMVEIPKELRKGLPKGDTLTINGGVPDAEAMKTVKWITPDPVTFITSWKSVFNTKDTEALKYLFMEFHEITPMEMMMLSGKSQPVPTEG